MSILPVGAVRTREVAAVETQGASVRLRQGGQIEIKGSLRAIFASFNLALILALGFEKERFVGLKTLAKPRVGWRETSGARWNYALYFSAAAGAKYPSSG